MEMGPLTVCRVALLKGGGERLEKGYFYPRKKRSTSKSAFDRARLMIIRGEQIVFSGPNMNTNIIRVHKFDRIRIRILFVFFIMTEYEYYSGSEI